MNLSQRNTLSLWIAQRNRARRPLCEMNLAQRRTEWRAALILAAVIVLVMVVAQA